jgi:hypothetical protein
MLTDLISLEWVTPLLTVIGGMWVVYRGMLVLDGHLAKKRLAREREYLRKHPRDPDFPPLGSL